MDSCGTKSSLTRKSIGRTGDAQLFAPDRPDSSRSNTRAKSLFEINYTLNRDTVEVSFIFQNEEMERQSHVSFGLHPGLAVSSFEQARVVLPKGTYRRHLAPNNFLSGETVEFDSDGATMPIKPFELPGSFLLETIDVDSYVVKLLDYARNRQVELDFSDAPYFTIWSDLNPFICIEPCWGLPDHQEQRPFEKKLGHSSDSAARVTHQTVLDAPHLRMNFVQTLRKRSELQPGVPALIDRCLSGDRVLTYSGLNRLVDYLSFELREKKVASGDRILIGIAPSQEMYVTSWRRFKSGRSQFCTIMRLHTKSSFPG